MHAMRLAIATATARFGQQSCASENLIHVSVEPTSEQQATRRGHTSQSPHASNHGPVTHSLHFGACSLHVLRLTRISRSLS